MTLSQLTRRDFLKIAASGALGLVFSELGLKHASAAAPASKGLALFSGVPIRAAPAVNANKIELIGKDEVFDLLGEVQGESFENIHNTTWYAVNGGYVHSAPVLPVETNYQKPVYDLPAGGQLAEVSAPFSLTYRSPYYRSKNAHRIYYESTHWVRSVVVEREEKNVFYEIYDKELKQSFYVPSYNMRLIPNDELTQLSAHIPREEKFLHVDIKSQIVTAFEGDKLVLSTRCSSGQRGTDTPTGKWDTYHKGPSIHMTNRGDAVANIYNLPGVPWTSFFTGSGHAFHGTYWHNDYGRKRSNGCVNLPSRVAKWVYRWTSPVLPYELDYLNAPGEGTQVTVV